MLDAIAAHYQNQGYIVEHFTIPAYEETRLDKHPKGSFPDCDKKYVLLNRRFETPNILRVGCCSLEYQPNNDAYRSDYHEGGVYYHIDLSDPDSLTELDNMIVAHFA